MSTKRILVLLMANAAVLSGAAYFAVIDIRGIFAPLVLLAIIDAVAIRHIFKQAAGRTPNPDHS